MTLLVVFSVFDRTQCAGPMNGAKGREGKV